ncbi:MAG TPA: molybdopterin cofactor-binding domain-containing protein [Candidatus Methylomirabilis sp.]
MVATVDHVDLTINGVARRVPWEPEKSLLEALRDDLRLLGSKNGCGTGHCGSCTVILNGHPKKACVVPLEKAAGGQVTTIEGLAVDGRLDPVQHAFMKEAGFQCGACTPGYIVAVRSLLDKHPRPTRDQINRALALSICRCTGYNSILEAIYDVVDGRYGSEPSLPRGVGSSPVRNDAYEKVTGAAPYADDLYLPGMLHGATLRAGRPHARILRIDTARAEALPGVHAVLTAKDVPGTNRFGLITADQPVLCADKVRYVGDPVAIVAADTRRVARRALELIAVEYEDLPPVLDVHQALADGAPLVHEGHPDRNILCHVKVRHDAERLERAFAESAVVVEQTYELPCQEHAYLEPEACVGEVEPDGTVTVWTGSQNVFSDRMQIAANLAVPVERVRVRLTTTGGAFGGKEDLTCQIHAALLARRLNRPVKFVYSREESLIVSTKRHPMVIRQKTGAALDGKLKAQEVTILSDTGPYASFGYIVMLRAATHAMGPYEVEAAKIDAIATYTNNAIGGAMRGFGTPQANFACECNLDVVAEKLGMDPIELRRRNAVKVGSTLATGHVLEESVGLRDTIEKAAAAAGWPDWKAWRREKPGRGIGVACGFKNVGLGHGEEETIDRAGARVEVDAKGRVTVFAGAADNGQGINQVIGQVASQVLQVDFDQVRVVMGDTKTTPNGGVSSASRQTFMTGNAVMQASEKLIKEMKRLAAPILGLPPQMLEVRDGRILAKDGTGRSVSWGQVAAAGDEPVKAEVEYVPPATKGLGDRGHTPDGHRMHVAYGFATQIAFVEANREKGEVQVVKMIAAHDVGKAIHPPSLIGQIEGGISMGLGMTLSEEYILENGHPKTLTFKSLGLPTISTTPEVVSIIVEDPASTGPFGAKGAGELVNVPTPAAIINAIYDATGVRVTRIPATPKRLKALLQARAGAPAPA